MGESLEAHRDGRRRYREEQRRREAEKLLQLTAAMSGYAARQLADGLSPGEARHVVVTLAGDLESAAASLRSLARIQPEERRALARLLAAQGATTTAIARSLGVSTRAVRYYKRGRMCPGRSGEGGG